MELEYLRIDQDLLLRNTKEDLMQQLPLIMIVGLNVFFQHELDIVGTKKTI